MWLGGISTERGADLEGSRDKTVEGCLLGNTPSGLLAIGASCFLGSAGDKHGNVGEAEPKGPVVDVTCLIAGEREGREGVVMLL